MTRVLLTGAAGFIGSHVAACLDLIKLFTISAMLITFMVSWA